MCCFGNHLLQLYGSSVSHWNDRDLRSVPIFTTFPWRCHFQPVLDPIGVRGEIAKGTKKNFVASGHNCHSMQESLPCEELFVGPACKYE